MVVLVGVLQWSASAQKKAATGNGPSVTDNDQGGQIAQTIHARHSYANGRHTVLGAVMLPTPCHGMKTETMVRESFPEQVVLNFTVTAPPEGQMCVQMIDERQFGVEVAVSEQATFEARVNGDIVPLVMEAQ